MIWRSFVTALLVIGLQSCTSRQTTSDEAPTEDGATIQPMDLNAVKAANRTMDFDAVKIDAERGDASAQNILG